MCNNKTFSKLFFFSFAFLFASIIMHVTLLTAAKSSFKKENISTNEVSIQIQQKQIIKRLRNVEDKNAFSEQDLNHGRPFKKERL